MIAAKKKIKELELAAQKKKEQEELKAKELVDKKPERLARKNLQDNKNIRLEKYDTHFIEMINKESTKILDKVFEDVEEGSSIKEDSFLEIFDNLLDRLKETFKEFVDLFDYKTFNGGNRDLIETEVDKLKDTYEDRYNIITNKTVSKTR